MGKLEDRLEEKGIKKELIEPCREILKAFLATAERSPVRNKRDIIIRSKGSNISLTLSRILKNHPDYEIKIMDVALDMKYLNSSFRPTDRAKELGY